MKVIVLICVIFVHWMAQKHQSVVIGNDDNSISAGWNQYV